jgi:predicted nucleotidyltransferase
MERAALPRLGDIEQRIGEVLTRYPAVTLAILFGSLAAGRAHSNSDLDVAVLATTPLTSQARVNMMGDLALAFGRPVDLIDLSRTHCPLLQQVLTRGRLVLCKDRSQYAELIRRMAYEEADFMPYYRRILAVRRKAWIGT